MLPDDPPHRVTISSPVNLPSEGEEGSRVRERREEGGREGWNVGSGSVREKGMK